MGGEPATKQPAKPIRIQRNYKADLAVRSAIGNAKVAKLVPETQAAKTKHENAAKRKASETGEDRKRRRSDQRTTANPEARPEEEVARVTEESQRNKEARLEEEARLEKEVSRRAGEERQRKVKEEASRRAEEERRRGEEARLKEQVSR